MEITNLSRHALAGTNPAVLLARDRVSGEFPQLLLHLGDVSFRISPLAFLKGCGQSPPTTLSSNQSFETTFKGKGGTGQLIPSASWRILKLSGEISRGFCSTEQPRKEKDGENCPGLQENLGFFRSRQQRKAGICLDTSTYSGPGWRNQISEMHLPTAFPQQQPKP